MNLFWSHGFKLELKLYHGSNRRKSASPSHRCSILETVFPNKYFFTAFIWGVGLGVHLFRRGRGRGAGAGLRQRTLADGGGGEERGEEARRRSEAAFPAREQPFIGEIQSFAISLSMTTTNITSRDVFINSHCGRRGDLSPAVLTDHMAPWQHLSQLVAVSYLVRRLCRTHIPMLLLFY